MGGSDEIILTVSKTGKRLSSLSPGVFLSASTGVPAQKSSSSERNRLAPPQRERSAQPNAQMTFFSFSDLELQSWGRGQREEGLCEGVLG